MSKGLFIASTGQHVGKSTTCLGLLTAIRKRVERAGFMKPVGQEHLITEDGTSVDKDVVLFKEVFHLKESAELMSPVLFPPGFTKDIVDGKVDLAALKQKVKSSFDTIAEANDFVLVEGTGHMGVGSIADLNNAQVAKLLGLPVAIIISAGLGSAFDDLALNKALCEKYGVNLIGVIVNRVDPRKHDMIVSYLDAALKPLGIPLLGAIPYDPFLSAFSMKDFELLFDTTLLSGIRHRMRHFKQIRLVATSMEAYRKLIAPEQLVITPATRDDIVLATLTKHWDLKISNPGEDLKAGLILTGSDLPDPTLIEQIKQADIPALYVPLNTFTAMKMINNFTAKIRKEDTEKVKEAIEVVASHLDVESMMHNL